MVPPFHEVALNLHDYYTITAIFIFKYKSSLII